MRFNSIATLLVLLALGPFTSRAEYNYPEIDWKTHKTEHFVIHYYDDVDWTARKVAKVAEEIFPVVTGIYNHKPRRRTHIVVRDDEDTSNGFAVFNLNWVTIWASPSTLSLRGRHDWIQGVLTHEFAHVVSLQASSGAGYLVEGLRFGGIANTDTSENTDVGGSAYILTQPAHRWWAEGTAQLDTSTAGYDLWDTMQDTLLRSATLESNLLTFDQMHNITVRENFGGELVYNQGYAFLLWLRETYGEDANVKIAKAADSTWNLDFDKNFPKAIGKSFHTLYYEWKAHLQAKYEGQVSAIRKAPREGTRISLIPDTEFTKGDPDEAAYKDGIYNFYPRFSPDGRWFSYINRGTLYLRYLDRPYVLEAPSSEDEEKKQTDKPVGLTVQLSASTYDWSPDSKKIMLSKRRANFLDAYPYYDLYVANLEEITSLRSDYLNRFKTATGEKMRKKLARRFERDRKRIDIDPKQITERARGTHVSWSPDGNNIAYSNNQDGHRHLRLIDPQGENIRDLVAIGGDAEATEAAWSTDGKWIAFTLFHHGQADIWIVRSEGGKPRPLTLDSADDRQPTFTPDGHSIVFSSDRSGIFQLYRLAMDAVPGVEPTALTNVETGAFMPFVSKEGNEVLYSRFSSFGFKPYRISMADISEKEGSAEDAMSEADVGLDQLQEVIDRQQTAVSYPEIEGAGSYFPWPRPVRIFPSLLFENDRFKAGVALQVSDYLEKHNFTALALFGDEQDYQVSYINKMFHPSIFAGYTAYLRDTCFSLLSTACSQNFPIGNINDNIQFVEAGITEDFRLQKGLPGKHTLTLTYNRRFVDRGVGFPIIIDNEATTNFRLITNDGVTLGWSYANVPSIVPRDFDINPRNAWFASASYSLVHTRLFTADTTLSTPSDNYYHHEGVLSLEKYIAMPLEQAWWNKHTYWVRFLGGYKSRDVTNLDEFFLGGRLNFRAFGQISDNTQFFGYEDFSISGESLLLLSTGYTFPIKRGIDKKWGFFYFDSVYGTLFGEVGNAWNFGEFKNLEQNPTRDSSLDDGEVVLADVGVEIKIKTFLFNDFNPWNSVLRVAYGIQDTAANGFSDDDLPVRFYLGVGTNF